MINVLDSMLIEMREKEKLLAYQVTKILLSMVYVKIRKMEKNLFNSSARLSNLKITEDNEQEVKEKIYIINETMKELYQTLASIKVESEETLQKERRVS